MVWTVLALGLGLAFLIYGWAEHMKKKSETRRAAARARRRGAPVRGMAAGRAGRR